MRLLLSFTLIIILYPVFAHSIEQKVTVSTQGKPDYLVRLEAKNQALINSLDKLPSVIWGTESIQDNSYSDYIQSIGYAHAEVTILNESFDRVNQTYSLNASIAFDKESIMNTLSIVSDGQFALSTLSKIRGIMETSDLSRFIVNPTDEFLPLNIEASLYTNPYFYAQTHAELVSFHEGLIKQFSYLLAQQTKTYLSQYSVTLLRITKDHFTYHLKGPPLSSRLRFISTELQSIYDDYQDQISKIAGGICLFTPLGNRFFNLPEPSKALDITFQVNQEFATLSYPDYLYRNEMKVFDFVYCDGSTKQYALELHVAREKFLKEVVGPISPL